MYILLRLKAPLQSWGDNSKTETCGAYRGTATEPTFTGLLGLICACMGINSNRNPVEYSNIKSSFSIAKIYSNNTPTILKDYQTMGGGYDCTKYEANMVPRKINGKFPNSPGWTQSLPSRSKLSTREYLEDADFLVVLNVKESICSKMIESLKNPTWVPYFGRANCIPSTRIYVGCASTIEEYESLKDSI